MARKEDATPLSTSARREVSTSQNENGPHQEMSDGGVITLFPA